MNRLPSILRLEFIAPALLVALLIGALVVSGSSGEKRPPTTVPVSRATVVTSVSADGTIEPAQELTLNFEGFGRLTGVFVKEGQRVRRGQVIAVIEGAPQRAQLGSAEANLQSARARLDETRTGLTPTELALRTREADQSRVALRNAQRDLSNARRVADSNVAGLRRAVARARVTGEEADLRASELRLASEEDDVDRLRRHYDSARSRASADRQELYDQLQRQRDALNQDPPDQDQLTDANFRIQVLQSKIEAQEIDEQRAKSDLETARANVRNYVQDVDRDRVALREARRRLGSAQDDLRSGIAGARQQVDSARDTLATSQAQLQTTLARNRVDQQIKAADVANGIANVEQAQALLSDARKAVADTVLRAPTSGVVGHVNAEVGELTGGALRGISPPSGPQAATATPNAAASGAPQAAAAGPPPPAGLQPTEALLTLAQTRGLQFKANFDEDDAAAMHTGDRATVTVDSFPDRRFGATVASIDPIETVQNNVVSYEVTMALDSDAAGLRPGMSASADVSVAQVDDALTVPRTAVRSPAGANPSVIVVTPQGRQEVRMVATGLQGASRVQILAGVGLGERVLRTISPPPDVG